MTLAELVKHQQQRAGELNQRRQGKPFAAVIFMAIKLGHKKARDISKQFLTERPNAATLYLYGEDLPSNSAELNCIQGTVSKVYDPRTVPGAKVQKGAVCHVLPGKEALNVMITWSKSCYVVRKHGSMQARFTFDCRTCFVCRMW